MARQTIQNANASLYFNDSSGYMTSTVVPDPTGFNFSMWYKLNKNVVNNRLIDYSDSGPSGGMNLAVVGGNRLGFGIYNGGSITSNLLANLANGTWVHVVGTYKVDEVNLYVNGVLIGTDTSTTMSAPTQTLTFGRRSAAASNYFGGSMSNIVWHNTTTPWTAEQVLALYQSGTVPTGATAVYPLSEGAGSIAYDTSGNGNDGTITSGTWTRDTPTKTRKLVNNNLVYNGDFEIAPVVNAAQTGGDTWIDGSVAGSSTNMFGWYVFNYNGTHTANYDTSVYYSGTASLKLTLGATNSSIGVSTNKTGATPKNTLDGFIPILPNTSYTVSGRVKTDITSGSATTGAVLSLVEKNGATTSGTITTLVTGLITTQDWTFYTATVTTGATTRFATIEARLTGNNGAATLVGSAWFDDIQLYPTTPVTRSTATGRLTAATRSAA